MSEYDLVVRAGMVANGSGSEPFRADVAVIGGRIAEVGDVRGSGAREIDADGALVTPGFVDIHTHYDGQAVWDSYMQPSSWHGVTTAVMGNCGVGFAPVAPEHRELLIELMEGVEDIPGTALHEGLGWEWQSFGEYLGMLERKPRDIDIAAQVPHAALRFAAMGERAAAFEAATDAEIGEMAQLAKEAIQAGALGFTTSRTINHKSKSGTLTPVYGAQRRELTAIAAAVGETNAGVLQLITDFDDLDEDFALMRQMVAVSGRPLTVSLVQFNGRPRLYREVLARIVQANAEGHSIKAQVAARSMGIMLGLQCMLHPFVTNPVWKSLAHLPVAGQAARMADPGTRSAILAAQTGEKLQNVPGGLRTDLYGWMYELSGVPDYEPGPGDSIAARAERAGRAPEDFVYDVLIRDDGRGLIFQPFTNYADGNLDAVHEMLSHEFTIPGLSDGGAHVASICDGSFPTTLLQLWTRDRDRDRLSLPFVVRRQCRETALAAGLRDRGLLQPGYKADLNVIDLENLRLHCPVVSYDLPAGGRRFLQRAEGYRHTVVSGVETYADGQQTGELPGRLVRGTQEPVHRLSIRYPPFHTNQRRFLSPELSPRSVKEFAGHVARVVDDVIDEVIETGQCDLASDIGGKLASYVTADLMGLPRELLVDLYVLSEEINNTKSISEGQGLAAAMAMAGHAQSVFDDRKAAPRSDMVSRMVNGEYNGCPVDPLQFSLDFLLMVNAGGDTTRNVVGGGMLALFENPAQRAKLMADPELIPSGVDEMLRWVSPIVYQRRTATRDTEFAGRPIKKGTKLAGYYGAANRDPRAFPEADTFAVSRRPNAHVAFGFGPHFCLGSHLARQELIVMFRQLLARMPDLEQLGPAIWTLPPGVAVSVVGPRSIPVTFTPGPRVNS